MNRVVVTGGAGFIGSALVRHLIEHTPAEVCVIDKLTYAGNLDNLASVHGNKRLRFEKTDICDRPAVADLVRTFKPSAIIHLAAESHVDRSIDGPAAFIQTNVVGTFTLLEVARDYWRSQSRLTDTEFRFHHVSTDEVFGSLGSDGFFTENSAYKPNSPYSASKAASDHLVQAWGHTYGLPTVLSNCSNNYGPYQFPEKLIPLCIINAVEGSALPVYGKGLNVRDWLYVEDHARALATIALNGKIGASYNVGGWNEWSNIDVVRTICRIIDDLAPDQKIGPRHELITFVSDRPGHDLRYAIDPSKIASDLGWRPQEDFESGLRKTVLWYLENRSWWGPIRAGYASTRLGLAV